LLNVNTKISDYIHNGIAVLISKLKGPSKKEKNGEEKNTDLAMYIVLTLFKYLKLLISCYFAI
jgi:hypothetical protein